MSNGKIPADWVDSHKIAFEAFGVPSDELTRDELLATIGYLQKQVDWERINHRISMDIASLARKVST